MDTKIYSVFPACGKTWLYEHQENYDLKILDSDSSEFSWHKILDANGDEVTRIRHPNFPSNYIEHIKENMGKYDCIFVSSHASVRDALDKEGIDFTIVYPMQKCKAEWIGRCYIREMNFENGCSTAAMFDNFDQWHLECFETGLTHKEIVLDASEHLSDYFKKNHGLIIDDLV